MTTGRASSSLVPVAVMAIVCAAMDIAKNEFAIHDVDCVSEPFFVQPRVPRTQLLGAFSNLPSFLIAMESPRLDLRRRQVCQRSTRCPQLWASNTARSRNPSHRSEVEPASILDQPRGPGELTGLHSKPSMKMRS